jgi:hypothetical protein
MAEKQRTFKVGDRLTLTDISTLPEGSWVVRETMQFVRAVDGKSITSITPIDGGVLPTQRIPNNFTVIYAGHPQIEKSTAVQDVMNTL